jgi:hypothetical protein
MVFLTTNFWNVSGNWLSTLTTAQLTAVTNLVDKQMSGYTFIAYGALGDQPGQHQWHYLAPWQALPQGFMIATWKFAPPVQPFVFYNPVNGNQFSIYSFDYTNSIPFPTADTNTVYDAANGNTPYLPYIAFNYLGQLVSSANDRDVAGTGADIPLAQGSVSYALDPTTKIPQLTLVSSNMIAENPPGNSTNISYNVVHIDALTGRATLEYQKVQ